MRITEQVYLVLKKRLDTGVYQGGERFPPESSLADEFSVNKMTMNKVVSQLVKEHYLVRGIGGAGTRVVRQEDRPGGILACLCRPDPYVMKVQEGVVSEVSRYNHVVVIESPVIDEVQHRLRVLHNIGVRGLISIGYGIPELPSGMELCCVDQGLQSQTEFPVHFIDSDDVSGGLQMMQEILLRGHREILVFSAVRFRYNPQAPVTSRVRGFHQAMLAAGINDYEARTFYSAPDSLEDARFFLKDFLAGFPDTTVIAADSDYSAELLFQAGHDLGIQCPGKIALTGFGNITRLPIANVDQNPVRQGKLAVRYLMDRLQGKKNPPGGGELVETALVNTDYIPIINHR